MHLFSQLFFVCLLLLLHYTQMWIRAQGRPHFGTKGTHILQRMEVPKKYCQNKFEKILPKEIRKNLVRKSRKMPILVEKGLQSTIWAKQLMTTSNIYRSKDPPDPKPTQSQFGRPKDDIANPRSALQVEGERWELGK